MAAQQLPQFQGVDQPLKLMQDAWATMINPVLRNPLLQGRLMEDVSLVSGDNVLNHLLDRKLVGWVLTRIDGASSVYDKQATNQMPNKTLVLNSSAPVNCAIWVF